MRSMDCADQIFPNESKTNSSAVEANRNKLQEPGLSTHQTSAPDRKSGTFTLYFSAYSGTP
ncbi:hypothetical protein GUJ93_ZPchr0006g42342 [Zizania palustris]|uniref:Uncharacterized protein n=1 Tax=Zizania palustris TaxID=103762 RepID=A0A8J5SE12_ZIZPA|nr:hypothetical protein GUJ93_ZPchr0006g42342 [Zizania palustris]